MTTDFATYYQARCEEASKAQGIDGLVADLEALGVSASIEQTGGFTMSAYIELSENRYIYANPYGASIYGEEDFEKDLIQLDEENSQLVATTVAQYLKEGK